MPNINIVKKVKTKYTKAKFKKELPLHLMILPGLILVLIFSYVPMGGLIIAFQKFIPSKGMFGNQKWIGFDNFSYVFSLPGFTRAMMNTIIIAAWKIVLGLVVPIVFALLLNEVKGRRFKKVVQTIVYLPYFMSWVILGGIFRDMLSPGEGIINQIITAFGGKSIFFLGDNRYFRGTMIVTDIWKNFGYGAIVYLAAILGIDTQLYEAAQIDGANFWQRLRYVTLPMLTGSIMINLVFGITYGLKVFDIVYVLTNGGPGHATEVLTTYAFQLYSRGQYGMSSALNTILLIITAIIGVGIVKKMSKQEVQQ